VGGGLLLVGHGAQGNVPDWPWVKPEKAVAAAKTIYSVLVGLPKAGKTARPREWEEIEWKVRSLFWHKADLARRIEDWKSLIRAEFLEEVDYLDMPMYLESFAARAKEQRDFVLKLIGVR
jgi:hypothetical protein